jgi:thioredoxin 1
MPDSYFEVTQKDFTSKVLKAQQIVIVNFVREESSACQIFEPEFVAISKEYQGKIDFAQVAVDKAEALTTQWNIDGVPTLVFFKNGSEVYRIRGVVMRDKLRRQIEGALVAHGE